MIYVTKVFSFPTPLKHFFFKLRFYLPIIIKIKKCIFIFLQKKRRKKKLVCNVLTCIIIFIQNIITLNISFVFIRSDQFGFFIYLKC